MTIEANFAIPGLMELRSPESEDLPVFATLQPHTEGRQWIGIAALGPVTVNGELPEDEATAGELRFYESMGSEDPPAVTLEVTVDDAVAWLFSVPPQLLDLGPGNWWWEFWVTHSEVESIVYQGKLLVRHGHG